MKNYLIISLFLILNYPVNLQSNVLKRAMDSLNYSLFEEAQHTFNNYQPREAIEKLDILLQKIENSPDTDLLIKTYLLSSTINICLNNFKAAEAHASKAYRLSQVGHKKKLEAHALHTLGYLYYKLSNPNWAKENLQRALKFYEDNSPSRKQALAYLYLAAVYEQLKKPQFAIASVQKSITILGGLDCPDILIQAKQKMAGLLHLQGAPDSALYYYQQSYQLTDQLHINGLQAFNAGKIAQIYAEKGAPEKAASYFQEAFKLANPIDSIYTLRNASGFLSLYFRARKDYEKALFYQKHHQKSQKKIDQLNLEKAIQGIQIDTKRQSLQNQLRTQKLEKHLVQEQQYRTQKRINFMLYAAIFVMALIAIWAHRSLYIKRSINSKLLDSNRMIKQKKREILEQTRIIEQQKVYLDGLNNNKNELFRTLSNDLKVPIISLERILGSMLTQNLSADNFMEKAIELKRGTAILGQDLNNILQLSNIKFNYNEITPCSTKVWPVVEEVRSDLKRILSINDITLRNNSREGLTAAIHPDCLKEIIKYLATLEINQSTPGDELLIGFCAKKPDRTLLIVKIKKNGEKAIYLDGNCEEYLASSRVEKNNKGAICREILNYYKGKLSLMHNQGSHKWIIDLPKNNDL